MSFDKYHRNDIIGVERENERDESYQSTKNPQIDNTRSCNNFHTIDTGGSYLKRINARIKKIKQKRKIKDDEVLMCSFILGSDKEFFNGLTKFQRRDFFYDVTGFLAERYGYENILSAVVHLDETTPHMHLNLIPVFEGRLCEKRLFDRVKLRELQSDFHEAVGNYAKASGIVTYNPVEMIPFKRAERENRDRLTDEQIKTFLNNLKTPAFDKTKNFAYVMYFFGLRPCEIDEEAHFENGFLICRNRKRKNGKKAYKKIPIPRQAQNLFDFNSPLKSPLSYDRTLDIMKKALPDGIIPYQLRHTFASVCDETVKREVVELWMGDSPERLVGKTYVHYSDEFMRNEMDKVNFVVV